MILVAVLVAAPLAAGCRRVDRSVVCQLAPAAPPALPVVRDAPPTPPPARVAVPVRPRPVKPPPPSPSEPPDDAAIARQTARLTAIADCTGVRTYLTGIDRGDLAATAFDRCVAGAPPPAIARR